LHTARYAASRHAVLSGRRSLLVGPVCTRPRRVHDRFGRCGAL